MLIPWYINQVFINLCVLGRYHEQGVGNGARKKSWCIEYQNLMLLATDIYSGNIFRFMKLEESVAGEDSKPKETCSELAGTHFTINTKKSNEYSGVQKVRNLINCGIPWNSEWISQPRLSLHLTMIFSNHSGNFLPFESFFLHDFTSDSFIHGGKCHRPCG